jgi:hypothetical protein
MTLKLPDSVASQQDLAALVAEVRDYAKWWVHESIKKRINVKHTSVPPQVSPGAAQIIHEWGSKKELSRVRFDELITTLQGYSKSATTITITLPAPASPAIKATLVGWCRTNIAPDVFVTFGFNATLLGGMVVRFGSRVYDWSFRRQILANRANFPEVLRRV